LKTEFSHALIDSDSEDEEMKQGEEGPETDKINLTVQCIVPKAIFGQPFFEGLEITLLRK